MIDSGKTMDLDGDGIIEMGEENYYETPPDEVTYFTLRSVFNHSTKPVNITPES